MLRVKNLLLTSHMIQMAKMLRVALSNADVRRIVQREMNISNLDVLDCQRITDVFLQEVAEIPPADLQRQIGEELGRGADITISLNKHLTTLDLLLAFEVARLSLGLPMLRQQMIERIQMADADAERVYRALSALMADVRAARPSEQIGAGPRELPDGRDRA